MKKWTLIILLLSIISISSIIINLYLIHKLNRSESTDFADMENLIRNDYFDDLKMLSSQIVNSKSNYYEITDNFERVNKDFLIEVRSKGQYGDIELKNILIKFDSLGFTRGIYLNNDSITRE